MEISKLETKNLYIYFIKCKRDGAWYKKIFGKNVTKYAAMIQKESGIKRPVINHMGLLFFDGTWKIAELDYFEGGKITKDVSEIQIQKMHCFAIKEATNFDLATLYKIFPDQHQKLGTFYSLRRYGFKDIKGYLPKRNAAMKMPQRILLQSVLFLQYICSLVLGTPKNSGYTCVNTTLEYLSKINCKVFEKERTPYELFDEISKGQQ